MAERRMFSKTVVDSDAFSEMPLTTQALYFRLGMQADDDGFVNNPKLIQRMIGASEDDLKLLLAKGFLIAFESGVVVVTHWRIHNYIQKDRYKNTVYQEEWKQLILQSNSLYILQNGSASGLKANEKQMDTDCIQSVSKMDTQVRLGKSSIDIHPLPPQGADARQNETQTQQGESLTVETAQGAANKAVDHSTTLAAFDMFWQAYPRKVGKKAAKKEFDKANMPVETLVAAIERQKCGEQWQKDNGQYIPNPATWLHQGRWEDEAPQQTQKGGDLPWF